MQQLHTAAGAAWCSKDEPHTFTASMALLMYLAFSSQMDLHKAVKVSDCIWTLGAAAAAAAAATAMQPTRQQQSAEWG